MDLDVIYQQQKRVLWVEDAETHTYLDKLLLFPETLFLVAPGKDGVEAMVLAACRAGKNHVFGLVDLDFECYQSTQYQNLERYLFRTERHEIENYLLNASCLAVLPARQFHQRSIEEIEQKLQDLSDKQICYMAVRTWLHEQNPLARAIPGPKHSEIQDLDAAVQWIHSKEAELKITENYRIYLNNLFEPNLKASLEQLETRFRKMALSERLKVFSGKELLEELHGFLSRRATKADLFKAMGKIQSASPPSDLLLLRNALLQRIP